MSSLIGFKTKHTVPIPSWVAKPNEIPKSSSTSQMVGCLIDFGSPQTSPTSTHKFVFYIFIICILFYKINHNWILKKDNYFYRSSSDGNSVDSFNSDFGPWKGSQAESSGFEDDFDLLCSNADMDYFKNRFSIENSLPPPTLPPPMLPPDALNVLLNGPKLPPRPNEMVSPKFKPIGNI